MCVILTPKNYIDTSFKYLKIGIYFKIGLGSCKAYYYFDIDEMDVKMECKFFVN